MNKPTSKENKKPVIIMESCGCIFEGKTFLPCMLHRRDFFSKTELELKYCFLRQRKMNEHIMFTTPKGVMIT